MALTRTPSPHHHFNLPPPLLLPFRHPSTTSAHQGPSQAATHLEALAPAVAAHAAHQAVPDLSAALASVAAAANATAWANAGGGAGVAEAVAGLAR
ncbi:hypothetical protein ACJ73_06991, partial [Blastomyces percursus]